MMKRWVMICCMFLQLYVMATGSSSVVFAEEKSNGWLEAPYKGSHSLKQVPEVIREALLAKFRDDPRLADHGEPFEPTDMLSGPPQRRFLFGGQSDHFVLICYEHGGYAPHRHVVVFQTNGNVPGIVFAGFLPPAAETIEDVKDLVRRGALHAETDTIDAEW